MKEKLIRDRNEAQRQIDEIINLSSLLDVCVSETSNEKTNYLDVDLILKTPLSKIKARKHNPAHSIHYTNQAPTKIQTQTKGHSVVHPNRENLIHFHAHFENKKAPILGGLLLAFFPFLRLS
jgi:hypothetical protein